jgi:hypothetical protein
MDRRIYDFPLRRLKRGEIPGRPEPWESRLVLAETCFQVEPLAAVLSFPRKREFRSRQNLDARFRGHGAGFRM